ncbi:MAG: DUF1573 domain-containing protein [Planctomycetaceae bacterium]|nr:DUF1573 domain-containing protein [Planctomycetaceae bacterium]
MDVKTVIAVVVLILVSLGITAWIGVSSQEVGAEKNKVTYESQDEEDAPPIDDDDKRPKAVTEETSFNFGSMELGETGKHTFLLKNEGEDVLVIAKGASTCKCTVSDLPSNEIPPGETAEVLLEWEPKAPSPEFSQRARIWTNDPERRAIDFSVQGMVADLLTVSPSGELDAGNVQEDVGASARFRIYSNLADSFDEPPTMEYEGDFLSFEVKPFEEEDLEMTSAKSGYVVQVKISPDVPAGRSQETFGYLAKVDGREFTEQMTVKYRRRGPIRVMPLPGTVYFEKYGLVDFQRFQAAEGKTQEVTLLIEDPEDDAEIDVAIAEVEVPQVKVDVEPKTDLNLKGKQAFRLRFEIPPGAPPVDFARQTAPKVILKTTHPELPEIELHVEAHSR